MKFFLMQFFLMHNKNSKNRKDSKTGYKVINLGRGESLFERPGKRVYELKKDELKRLATG